MEPKNKQALAVSLKHGGYNCCQAVLCAFADETDLPRESLLALGAGFGVGMGTMEATCGALIAAELLLGLKRYAGKPLLRDAAALHRAFEARCGAVICKDLKGAANGAPVCPCDDCVRAAAALAEELQ